MSDVETIATELQQSTKASSSFLSAVSEVRDDNDGTAAERERERERERESSSFLSSGRFQFALLKDLAGVLLLSACSSSTHRGNFNMLDLDKSHRVRQFRYRNHGRSVQFIAYHHFFSFLGVGY